MGCPECSPAVAAPTYADAPPQAPRLWGIVSALLVWLFSVAAALLLPAVVALGYIGLFDRAAFGGLSRGEMSPAVALVSIIGAFIAHALTLVLCWLVVTWGGRRPFWATLGWGWRPQFKWVHAVAVAVAMLALGALFEQVLPHSETEFERLLRISPAVRVAIALLAVLTAPLVEEIVYRGILYSALERAQGKALSVAVVTLIFALVHVPQYRQSLAVIAAVLSLSLVLTLIRAATGRLLPCVATHFVFNGIQAAVILLQKEKAPGIEPAQPALAAVLQWCGLG